MKNMHSYNYIVLGLGNPGKEYEHTRHNAGRNAVLSFAKTNKSPLFEEYKKLQSIVAEHFTVKSKVLLVLPETFMNKSGNTVSALKLSVKSVQEKLLTLHDDLDLPLGTIKIVKNRGSAGHKGIESVMRSAKTKDFIRIRIGIAKPKDIIKSQTKEVVHKIVIGKLSPEEQKLLQKGVKKAVEALAAILERGLPQAMNEFN